MEEESPAQSEERHASDTARLESAQRVLSWIGTTLADKYHIDRLIGSGGMGSVYLAHHTGIGRQVAVKMLHPEYGAHPSVLKRFENEAKAIGRLAHPNLVAVTDFGWAGTETPYIVMEYLEGADCATLLRRHGPLPVARTAELLFQASLGLAVAHRAEIVHRDIKPENLFVTSAGDGNDLVKVLDFGIAKLRATAGTTATTAGATIGTYFYMSPEQVRDSARVDARTDVWSMGVVLYELLSGRRPFTGEEALEVAYHVVHATPKSLEALRPDLPAELIRVVEKAMAKDAAERFATIDALGDALAPFTGRNTLPPRANPRPAPKASSESSRSVNLALDPTKPALTTSHAGVAISSPIRAASRGAPPRRLVLLAAGSAALAVAVAAFVYALGGPSSTGLDAGEEPKTDAGRVPLHDGARTRASAAPVPRHMAQAEQDGGVVEPVALGAPPPSPSIAVSASPPRARALPSQGEHAPRPAAKRAPEPVSSIGRPRASKPPTAEELFDSLY